jgi:putative heme-binding domain-containing protein
MTKNRNTSTLQLLLWVLAAAVTAAPAWAQHEIAIAVDIEAGLHVYRAYCFSCHGPEGASVPGVDFRRGEFRHGSTRQEMAAIIRNGIPGTAMPANNLDQDDLRQVMAFITSLHDFQASTVKLGDAARGAELFKGKGQCLTCHRVETQGSRVSPDLSEIGATRSADFLRRTLLDPTAAMLPQDRFVRGVTKDGKVIMGRRLNENTDTVQLIDEHENLVSLVKADLREYSSLKTSPMPSYKDKFTADEMADVLAYLVSLKGSN